MIAPTSVPVRSKRLLYRAIAVLAAVSVVSGCGWRGLNSLPLPGTDGRGPGSFVVTAQLPNVTNIQQNSRVRVGDVAVGTVTKIERQGWHALVTMRLDGDVQLPANATATVGQTSLLGALHIELAAPTDTPPSGELRDGDLIPLANASSYPTTEQTLAALSMLLNGGGLGQINDITAAFSTAYAGREADVRGFIEELNRFATNLDDQTGDIIAAGESLDSLVGRLAAQKPVLRDALQKIPQALEVLDADRDDLVESVDRLGLFSAVSADVVRQSKDSLVAELDDLGPVLASLADAGGSLTRSLSLLTTYPWVKETLPNWMRGDYANLTAVIDLTLGRIDTSFFTGTRWEGDLTELEMQWGRTIGQLPSPATAGNPLVVPYRLDQGP